MVQILAICTGKNGSKLNFDEERWQNVQMAEAWIKVRTLGWDKA